MLTIFDVLFGHFDILKVCHFDFFYEHFDVIKLGADGHKKNFSF